MEYFLEVCVAFNLSQISLLYSHYNSVIVTAGLSEQLTLSFYSIFICVVFVTLREVM